MAKLKTPLPAKKCPRRGCSKSFLPEIVNQKYCSTKCRDIANNEAYQKRLREKIRAEVLEEINSGLDQSIPISQVRCKHRHKGSYVKKEKQKGEARL